MSPENKLKSTVSSYCSKSMVIYASRHTLHRPPRGGGRVGGAAGGRSRHHDMLVCEHHVRSSGRGSEAGGLRVCLNMPHFAAVCFALPREVIWRAVSGSYVLIFEFKKSRV